MIAAAAAQLPAWPALLGSSWTQLAAAALATTVMYLAVIAATRIVGLRSLAELSAFDLAMTVAVGAVVGRVALVDPSVGTGIVVLSPHSCRRDG